MTTLRERIVQAGFANRILTDVDLNNMLDGTPAARYGLVNKALKKDEIVKIRRGLYILSDKYRQKKLSKFYIASRIVPHSYISLESAMSYHGWIPEHVNVTTSIIAVGRTKKFITPYGEFDFNQSPINEYEFLTGVNRIEDVEDEPFFLASPLRALADYVYIKNISWQNITYLTDGLRIDLEHLTRLNKHDFVEVKRVYSSKRVLHFLDCLKQELKKKCL